MKQPFLFLGAICAFVAVAMGAFGAHGLKAVISPERLVVYQTAVSYQMWHALGLLGIACLQRVFPEAGRWWLGAGWSMFAGILLFSGSLYLLVLLDFGGLGIITPFGGVAFLLAWSLLAIAATKTRNTS